MNKIGAKLFCDLNQKDTNKLIQNQINGNSQITSIEDTI